MPTGILAFVSGSSALCAAGLDVFVHLDEAFCAALVQFAASPMQIGVDISRAAFLLFGPCADLVSYLRGAWSQGFEIPLKRWFGVASHRCPAESLRRDFST